MKFYFLATSSSLSDVLFLASLATRLHLTKLMVNQNVNHLVKLVQRSLSSLTNLSLM